MHYVEENHKHAIFSALFLEIDLPRPQRLITFDQLVRFPAIVASSFDIDLAASRVEDIFKLFCSPRCTLLFKELCATSSLDVAKRIGCIGESVLHKLGFATVSKSLREKFEEFCVAFVDVLSKSIYRFVICILACVFFSLVHPNLSLSLTHTHTHTHTFTHSQRIRKEFKDAAMRSIKRKPAVYSIVAAKITC